MSNCFTGVDIVGIISSEVGDRLAKSCERNKDGNFDIEYWSGEKVTVAAEDVYKKPISVSTMKTTSIRNCQSCGKPFSDCDIVYFVPLDNNIVCHVCAIPHDKTFERMVEIETTCNPVTTRYDVLVGILLDGGIMPTPNDESFLRWVSQWDDETAVALGRLLEKCLKVGGKIE